MPKTRALSSGKQVFVHQNNGLRKRCGCPRRAWAKCSHPWHFSFKWKATHHRFQLDKYASSPITLKDDARSEADRLRAAIRAGTFPPPAPTPAAVTPDAITLDTFMTKWRENARDGMKPHQQACDRSHCKRLGKLDLAPGEQFGAKVIGAITADDIETVFKRLGAIPHSTRNKLRQTLIHLQKWGAKKGYLARPWIVFSRENVARLKPARRDRRLVPDKLDAEGRITAPGEERRLLAHASPWLQRLIITALATCCRRGELLSLQWRDVDARPGFIRIRAEKSKTGDGRYIPISPALRAVLDMVKLDPAGKQHGPDAYVFGNAIGEQVKDPKKSWAACLKTAKLKEADLHFHDLRHEAASRLLEQGWPLQHVQLMLGHADAATTSIYVNATADQLADSMRRFPGPAPAQPLHDVAREDTSSVGLSGNDQPTLAANVSVN
jgi:integrase